MGDFAIRAAVAQQQKPCLRIRQVGQSIKQRTGSCGPISGVLVAEGRAADRSTKQGELPMLLDEASREASQNGAGGGAGEDDLGLCGLEHQPDSGSRSGQSLQGVCDLAAGARKNHIIQIPETKVEGT